MMHDPHDKPTPNPDNSNLLLFFNNPESLAIFKAMGMLEDTVFPISSMHE